MKLRMKIVAAICMIWCLVSVNSVNAEDYSEYVKEGSYIGLSFVYNGMSGDFDDTMAFTDGTTIWSVPDMDHGMGFGIVYGVRTDIGAFELGYQRTRHDTSTTIANIGNSTAIYNVIDFNFKYDILAWKQLRPYLLVGAGVPWLKIDRSRTNGTNYEDETFYGLEGNLGAGIAYYVTPQWAITGGAIFRYNWLPTIDGGTLEKELYQKTFGLTLGIAYTF